MSKYRAAEPHIEWQQLTLLDPTLIECNLRVTAHGPSGTALIGLWSREGDPGALTMQELYTGVELLDVERYCHELVRQMIGHELGRLSPF